MIEMWVFLDVHIYEYKGKNTFHAVLQVYSYFMAISPIFLREEAYRV